MIVERDFPDHPKTVKLCRLLGNAGAPLLILRIWAHCEQRRTDQLPRDPEDIAAICRWDGSARKLVTALVTCRWLDEAADAYVVHGWREKNASWLAKIQGGKKRAANAARNAAGQLSGHPPLNSTQPPSQLAGAMLDQQTASMRAPAGNTDGTVEWSGVELSNTPVVPKGTASSRAGGPESTPSFPNPDSAEKKETAAEPEATWLRCCAVFGRKKTAPSAQVMHTLADLKRTGALPDAEEWPCIEAFYRAALRDMESRERLHPRITAEALAGNLLAELDKARMWARENAGVAPSAVVEAIELDRLHRWFAGQWPEKPLPSSLEDLPEYLREEARRACVNPEPLHS